MQIATTKMVKIHYTLKDKDGVQIDTSTDKEPLEYMHGMGALIPGLEKELTGMDVGEKKHVVVPAKEAYGEFDESLVQAIPRDRFDVEAEIEVGQQFQADTPTGPMLVKVVKVTEDAITIDSNHELAGKTLYFDVEVLEIRDASEEEIAPYQSTGCSGSCGSCGCNCDTGNCDCE